MGCGPRELFLQLMCSRREEEKRFRAAKPGTCSLLCVFQPPPAPRQRSLWDHIPPYFARQYSRGSVSPLLQAGKMLSKYLGTAREELTFWDMKTRREGGKSGDLRGAPRTAMEWWPRSPSQLCFSEQAAPQLSGLGTPAASPSSEDQDMISLR